MMNRKTLLLFWLLGMLAPMAWIARHIPGYDALFETTKEVPSFYTDKENTDEINMPLASIF